MNIIVSSEECFVSDLITNAEAEIQNDSKVEKYSEKKNNDKLYNLRLLWCRLWYRGPSRIRSSR